MNLIGATEDMPSQQDPKSARCVPDPFLLLGVGSGDETNCSIPSSIEALSCNSSFVLSGSFSAIFLAIHAPPERRADGIREIKNSGPVLMTDALPIKSEYKAKIARKCR